MAKENDKSKTSKTARVMSLLSKKPEFPPAEEETASSPSSAPSASSPSPTPAGAASSQTPPILNTIGADAAVSGQIKSALEDALEAELNRDVSTSAPTPAQQAAPIASEPVPAAPETTPAAEPAPVTQSAPAAEPAAPVETQQDPVVPQTPVEIAAEQLGYINVMQVLVEEKAPKYIKMFGLCDCRRCLEDVKALALNHLPPKYVVLAENEMIPKLTFYEGKYSSDITAQLLHACKLVAQRPHHTRD